MSNLRKAYGGLQTVRMLNRDNSPVEKRLIGQSSAAWGNFLWVGEDLHLGVNEVAELRDYLNYWLENDGEIFPEIECDEDIEDTA